MTEPDNTRTAEQSIMLAIMELVERQGGITDAATAILAALRDSGWVDPEEAARLQVDLGRERFEHDETKAERDALLPVAEAARAWREAHSAVLAAIAGHDTAAIILAADLRQRNEELLAAAVDTWESREQPKIPGSTDGP